MEICTFAGALGVPSFTDVAVIATLPTAVGGAVYTVVTPLRVVDGLNEPHEVAVLPGVQLHVTPVFVPVIVAAIDALLLGAMIPGGGWLMLTSIMECEPLPPQPAVRPRANRMIERPLRFIADLRSTQLPQRYSAPQEIRVRSGWYKCDHLSEWCESETPAYYSLWS